MPRTKPKNALVQDQKAWAKMSKTMKNKMRKVLLDSDHDKVPDGFDCRPTNKRKQESFLPDDAKFAKAHNLVSINKKEIGRGSNGGVYQVKGKPDMVVKLGNKGDFTASLREEAEFYQQHGKEPLFIPTKAVSVGKSKDYGLLRPKVKDVLDPQHGLRDKSAFTDSRLQMLYDKLVALSTKGYVLDDGLQLGIDKAGRMLQFDLGLCEVASPDYAFDRNDQMWRDLLHRLGKSRTFGHLKQKSSSKSFTKSPTKSTISKPKNMSKSTSKSGAQIYINPKFHFHPKHKEIYQKVQQALNNFPEIKEIELNTFYPDSKDPSKHPTIEAIQRGKSEILFNIKMMPAYNTIYHELWHVVQKSRPSTKAKTRSTVEMDATIFGMARMPKSKLETNEMNYFGQAPKSKILSYAKFAKTQKEKGNKKYIDALVDKANNDMEKDKAKGITAKWKNFGKTRKNPTHNIKLNVVKGGKNFAKGYTPSIVNKYLKTNIRKSQQLTTNMVDPKDGKGDYLYTKHDLVKIPSWMKSSKKSTKSTTTKSALKSKPKSKPTSKKCSKSRRSSC